MKNGPWQQVAAQQEGAIARRQLNDLGVSRHFVRRQLDADRWVERSSCVISTFTGPPTWRHRVWCGVLHAGGSALVGGLTALEWHGLRNWHREDVTVLVVDELVLDPLPGVQLVRTRRSLEDFRATGPGLPIARIEPAALLFAGYTPSPRTAQGVLAAVVQQRLTKPEALLRELHAMTPLRRARIFRRTLIDIGGGAESLAELDLGRLCRRTGLPSPTRQVKRRDANGRTRFTDCEWQLPGGRVLVLEIDGAFHMDADHWEDDIARQRRLSTPDRTVIRCTARELRENPDSVVQDLKRQGLCA